MSGLDALDRDERMRLLQFVCSFAWADLEVQPEEREFIRNLMQRLGLSPGERASVQAWLERPPAPEGLDPSSVPARHRQVFLDAVQGVIAADGRIAPEEMESYRIFVDLVS